MVALGREAADRDPGSDVNLLRGLEHVRRIIRAIVPQALTVWDAILNAYVHSLT